MLVVMWDENMAKRLGEQIKMLRVQHGLSQESLAQRAGITKNQVQLIEAGRSTGRRTQSGGETVVGPSNPKLATLVGLALVFEKSVAEILADANV